MNPEAKFTHHPAAEIFPIMDEKDYDKLKADMVAKGLLEEIVTYENQILDGRHRYRACLETGVEPRFRDYDGNDPFGYVLSRNLHRRHLNQSQRAMIAAQLSRSPRGGDRSKAQICALTHAQAAELLNTSPRLVDKASALLNAAEAGGLDPEIVEAVRGAKMRLERAEKIAKLPRERQSEFLASKNGKAVSGKRKTTRRGQWDSQLEQISLEAERLSSRTLEVIRRAHSGGRMTPALIELALEICSSAAQRFEEAIDFLQQMPEQVSEQTRNKLPEQFHHQAQDFQSRPQVQSAPPAEDDEVFLD